MSDMALRSVKTGNATSRIALSYRAKYLDDERMELTLDAASDPGVLQLRVTDPAGAIVCERVIREWPYTIAFRAVASGRYEMELSNIGGQAGKRFTWSDWDNDFGGGGSAAAKLPAGVQAYAFLDVS
jgi:hypothetical protein